MDTFLFCTGMEQKWKGLPFVVPKFGEIIFKRIINGDNLFDEFHLWKIVALKLRMEAKWKCL